MRSLRFTIQFASIAVLYTLSWGMFSILPALNLTINVGWIQGQVVIVNPNVLTNDLRFAVVLNLLNSTTNAVLYLLNDVSLFASSAAENNNSFLYSSCPHMAL